MLSLFRPNVKRPTRAVWGAVALWLLGTVPAAAQEVRPASEPIVSTRIQHITEMISESPTDLPPYLVRSKDVYLLVTAGSAYTEIEVLANPEVPPVSVANALSSSLAGTSLSGRPVEWSADRYSAAKVSADTHHFGARHGANTVPIGTLMTGLRRAGLAPHLLLRIPSYSQTSLPPAGYGTKSFRWYDAHHLSGQSSVTVTAKIGVISFYRILAYYLIPPLIGLLGLGLAVFWSGRGSRDNEAQRRRFRTVAAVTSPLLLAAQFGGLIYLLQTPTPAALADLWFGSSTTTDLVLVLALDALSIALFLIIFHRQETRRFGAAPAAKASGVPMSDEEKAVRKRAAQWGALPHLVGAVAIGAIPFFINRTSPLYPYIHPLALFLPMLGAGLAGRILQTRLAKFTQKTLDADLTWRARQLGMTLGVRMPDVFVEDSSRAAHFAFASHQGHHITLSRKLTATFTPAELDFVLASHLAGMRRHTGSGRRWLQTVLPLLTVLPIFALLSARFLPGAPPLASFILSLWFPVALVAYLVLCLVPLLMLVGGGTQRQIKQEAETDQAALEATGDLGAALSAVGKLEGSSAPATNTARSEIAEILGRPQTARLVLRRAALGKMALTLRLAAAPGIPPDASAVSPFRSSSAAAEREPPR